MRQEKLYVGAGSLWRASASGISSKPVPAARMQLTPEGAVRAIVHGHLLELLPEERSQLLGGHTGGVYAGRFLRQRRARCRAHEQQGRYGSEQGGTQHDAITPASVSPLTPSTARAGRDAPTLPKLGHELAKTSLDHRRRPRSMHAETS